jgi:hypothetical protein
VYYAPHHEPQAIVPPLLLHHAANHVCVEDLWDIKG